MPTINQLIAHGREPQKTRRLHARLHDHTEEAELGAS